MTQASQQRDNETGTPPSPQGGDDSVASQPAPPPAAGQGRADVVIDDIQILFHKPLPDFDQGPIKAYAGVGSAKNPGNYFALVCERHLVPRTRLISKYQAIINPSMAQLVAKDVVFLPPVKEERFVLIYREAIGRRLLKANGKPALGLSHEVVVERVVQPMVSLLQDFRDRDFVHGQINPANIFDGGSERMERIVLGECLALPASYNQPALYETIERAMADPIARGQGAPCDDLYSFGATLAVLMRSQNPLEGLSDENILRVKMEMGSYGALVGNERFTGPILELLRGLLYDDPSQRWTIDEVLAWMDGRRLSPKQRTTRKKAARPLRFHSEKYLRADFLAMDMMKNVAEASQIIEDGSLAMWLDRSLTDKPTEKRYETALAAAREQGRGAGYQERLVSFVSCALDPFSPVRYRGYVLGGEGYGGALAEAMVQGRDIGVFADMLSQNIALHWLSMQQYSNLDVSSLHSRFENCRLFIKQQKMGYGIERCLYLLNPECHCLSDKLKSYFVTEPEAMMTAFEDLCSKGKAPTVFLDRHSVAFLLVKESRIVDQFLPELSADEHHRKILGNLRCLAALQKRLGLPDYPAIAGAFANLLEVVYKRYHDKETREKLKKNVDRYAASGDLSRMAALLENPDLIARDKDNFRKAMMEYRALDKEYDDLEGRLKDAGTFGRATGHMIAAVVSSVLSGIVMLMTAFMFISGQTSVF